MHSFSTLTLDHFLRLFSIFISLDCFQLKWMASSRVSGELTYNQFFISFGFQREVEAALQTQPPIPEGLISKLCVKFKQMFTPAGVATRNEWGQSKLCVKFKQMFTPAGVATRNEWGPILFSYVPVQYDKNEKRLEIMEGEFVGNRKTMRHMSLREDLKCEDHPFNDDNDDDEEHNDDDDVENDDGKVPDVVVADDILSGLCFLF